MEKHGGCHNSHQQKPVEPQWCNVLNPYPRKSYPARILWHAGTVIKILNIYAPNNVKENESFWEELNTITSNDQSLKPDIMLGDFNIVKDSLDRLPRHPNNPNTIAALGELKCNLDLVDGWRCTYPDKWEYSHHHTPNSSLGRIDRIYVGCDPLNGPLMIKLIPNGIQYFCLS